TNLHKDRMFKEHGDDTPQHFEIVEAVGVGTRKEGELLGDRGGGRKLRSKGQLHAGAQGRGHRRGGALSICQYKNSGKKEEPEHFNFNAPSLIHGQIQRKYIDKKKIEQTRKDLRKIGDESLDDDGSYLRTSFLHICRPSFPPSSVVTVEGNTVQEADHGFHAERGQGLIGPKLLLSSGQTRTHIISRFVQYLHHKFICIGQKSDDFSMRHVVNGLIALHFHAMADHLVGIQRAFSDTVTLRLRV
ncbi:MAG: hypothetical protein Q9175_003105, partial [Cornicularia normoerica]